MAQIETESKNGAVVPLEPMNIAGVLDSLPHRYPMLMVDRVVEISDQRIVAIKNVTINENYFNGHFPGSPVMPGVLQLEAMAQVGGILTSVICELPGALAFFMSADKVKFRKPVVPGDQLRIEFELTRLKGRIARGQGRCFVDGGLVSESEVTFMLDSRSNS
jgi:beta-hydroxyacyl-ACP dehydratase FabZ